MYQLSNISLSLNLIGSLSLDVLRYPPASEWVLVEREKREFPINKKKMVATSFTSFPRVKPLIFLNIFTENIARQPVYV